MSRSFADQGSDNIDFGTGPPILYSATTGTLALLFKRGAVPGSTPFPGLFRQSAAFNKLAQVVIISNGGADDGKIQFQWRAGGGGPLITTTNAWVRG